MVKIEEGKFYRTRDGKRVGPAKPAKFCWEVGQRTYAADGTEYGGVTDSNNDLIGEDLGDTTMGAILDGVRRATSNPLNKGLDLDRVTLDGQVWVRQAPEKPAPVELPKWKSHKIVQADKIVRRRTSGTLVLECGLEIDLADPAREGFANRLQAMMPQQLSGGYYVCYSDGYESWSPAKAFEEGYSRMPYGSHDVNSRLGGICTCGVTREELLDGVASLECPHRPFRA